MTDESAMIADAAGAAANAVPVVGGSELLGMSVSMIIVVAIILLLGWLYSRSRLVGGGSSDAIAVVATRSLGPKERLLIVEVADQQLLIGMTSTAVQTLHVFDAPVIVESTVASSTGFAERLRSAFTDLRQ